MIDVTAEYRRMLAAAPEILSAVVAGVGPETARRRPEPGEWAVVEVVAHLADSDERSVERIERMASEHEPVLEPYDQDALAAEGRYRDRSLPAELDRFLASRRRHLQVLDRLGEADWARVGVHGEHGRMTVAGYVAHCAAEDVDHLAQIVRTLAAVSP